ncbi:hypothetical protein AURDEDRAFT_160755 [Auricularia subglabra TFB-10046 SS5]|nr:hypothetical protein AURDEDRAFT_160755 [Auricularia subglabra TFB-10046 SS5]
MSSERTNKIFEFDDAISTRIIADWTAKLTTSGLEIIFQVALPLEFLPRCAAHELHTMMLALGTSTLFTLVPTVYCTIALTDGWATTIPSTECTLRKT